MKKIKQIIGEALGEASALFMSDKSGGKIIMPTEELGKIVEETTERIKKEIKKSSN